MNNTMTPMSHPKANMNWYREDQTVTGIYLGQFKVSGKVTNSRVKYGRGDVQHTVLLAQPITIFGTERTTILLDEQNLLGE